jgi:5-methylcytosine-specific restriction endonuclease McrA
MNKKEYAAYLKTELWQARRKYFLDFWDGRCALCNSAEDVQVHHRTYERLGTEALTDCLVLCDRCHTLHTNFTGHFLSGVYQAVQNGQ